MSETTQEFRIGDKVQFWDNRRSYGEVGGWAQYWWHGTILKVNRKTVQVYADLRKCSEIVPIERVELIGRRP
jgi:hypothetical protein